MHPNTFTFLGWVYLSLLSLSPDGLGTMLGEAHLALGPGLGHQGEVSELI